MNNNRHSIPLLATIASLLFWVGASALAGQHDEHMKIGKRGEVVFATETKVGDLTLRPGRYSFQHRVAGEEHFVRFVPWEGGNAKGRSGEVKCMLERLSEKASETLIYSSKAEGISRIARVVVAGESVAHVF